MDASDGRWVGGVECWSEEAHWRAFEGALSRQLLRVYDLQPERVRLDSPTAHDPWSVSGDGLFPFGHSTDHRQEWPQVNVLLSARDPL